MPDETINDLTSKSTESPQDTQQDEKTFYDVGENEGRIKDAGDASEVAYAMKEKGMDTAEKVEERVKAERETGLTERERNHAQLMERLEKTFPHALTERYIGGEKVLYLEEHKDHGGNKAGGDTLITQEGMVVCNKYQLRDAGFVSKTSPFEGALPEEILPAFYEILRNSVRVDEESDSIAVVIPASNIALTKSPETPLRFLVHVGIYNMLKPTRESEVLNSNFAERLRRAEAQLAEKERKEQQEKVPIANILNIYK